MPSLTILTRSLATGVSSAQPLFWRGFVAMLPLWSGAIPFGIAYGISAREVGFTALETQLMSLTLFSAASQISVISLYRVGASSIEILATAIALNIHLVLVGATITRQISIDWFRRVVGGWFLTDASYAVAVAHGPLRFPILLGTGVSMYLGWNIGTAAGSLLGHAVPDPDQLAIDFVVPLTFLSVLIPMLRSRITLLVAVIAAGMTVVLASTLPLGVAILSAGLLSSVVGATFDRSPTEANVEKVES